MAAENSDTLKLKDNLIPGGKVLYEMSGGARRVHKGDQPGRGSSFSLNPRLQAAVQERNPC